jgi:hypothetical protein
MRTVQPKGSALPILYRAAYVMLVFYIMLTNLIDAAWQRCGIYAGFNL